MQARGGYRIIALAMLIISISIFSAMFAYSFGLGTPYLDNNTLRLEPGQSYNYVLNIQNGDDIEFDVDFNYSSDGDIARLVSLDRHILPRTYDNKAVIEIKIPDDAAIGTLYSLAYSAKPIINQTGQVMMTVEIKRSLSILVVDKNGQGRKSSFIDNAQAWLSGLYENNTQAIHYALIVIIIILLYFISKRLWTISKNVSKGLTKVDLIAQMPISEAHTIEDVSRLLELIPEEQFDMPEIRKIFSEKLTNLNEGYIGKKILTVKDKKYIIGMIKE